MAPTAGLGVHLVHSRRSSYISSLGNIKRKREARASFLLFTEEYASFRHELGNTFATQHLVRVRLLRLSLLLSSLHKLFSNTRIKVPVMNSYALNRWLVHEISIVKDGKIANIQCIDCDSLLIGEFVSSDAIILDGSYLSIQTR